MLKLQGLPVATVHKNYTFLCHLVSLFLVTDTFTLFKHQDAPVRMYFFKSDRFCALAPSSAADISISHRNTQLLPSRHACRADQILRSGTFGAVIRLVYGIKCFSLPFKVEVPCIV